MKLTNYFQSGLLAPQTTAGEIAEINARIVPIALTALETRKARSFWESDADYAVGYNEITLLQRALLMGGVERIVREIRALRNGQTTPLADEDYLLNPFDLDLFSIKDLGGFLATNGESAAFILATIRQLLIDSAANDAIDSETLAKIAAIVVGVV